MDISLFRSIANQYQEWRSVYIGDTLNVISYLIEEQVLNHRIAADLFLGFQRFSEFLLTEVPRYYRLGASCRRIYIFGVRDITPPTIPGIQFIELTPDSSLAQERFLIVNTPDFWTALLAKEVNNSNGSDPEKRFDGGWFCDEHVVERVALLISQVLGTFYDPVQIRNYAQQSAHIAEINRRLLKKLEKEELIGYRRLIQLSTIQQFTAVLLQNQSLPNILRDATQVLTMIFGADDALMAVRTQGEQFMVVSVADNSTHHKQVTNLGAISEQVMRDGRAVLIPDMRQTGNFDLMMPNAQTVIAAPIKGHKKVYGVVIVSSHYPHQWDKEDTQIVLAVANLLTVEIRHKFQNGGDTAARLKRGQQLEEMVTKLRKPMTRLLALHTKLLDEVHLLPVQKKLMTEVEILYSEIAEHIGVPRTVKATNESKLPTSSKKPPVFGGKITPPETSSRSVASARLSPDSPDGIGNG